MAKPGKIVSLVKYKDEARKAQVKKWQSEMKYCGRGLPRHPVPPGYFLVHNHVKPQKGLGLMGFRAWVQRGSDRLVECGCDFGGLKNAGVQRHYKVQGLEPIECDPICAALMGVAQ